MTDLQTLPEPDAASPEVTAHLCGVCRTIIYRAINPDPAKRGALPFLPSLKIGASRRIRREARLQWLSDLEAAAKADQAA
jgi:hypothetical protein